LDLPQRPLDNHGGNHRKNFAGGRTLPTSHPLREHREPFDAQ
jgi:hypothetical protein